MSKKLKCLSVVSGFFLLGLAAYIPILKNEEQRTNNVPDDIVSKQQQNSVDVAAVTEKVDSVPEIPVQKGPKIIRNVSPTLGLDSLIDKFTEEIIAGSAREIALAENRLKHLKLKKNGGSPWANTKQWMKSLEYYKELETTKLATECFENPVFFFEASLFDDSALGFQRLEIHHEGFSELFKREDFADGVIHAYRYLGDKIKVGSSYEEVMCAASSLVGLGKLYEYKPFKRVVIGREKDFLAVNLYVIKKFRDFLDTYKPEDLGIEPNEPPGFFNEPCSLVNIALVLAKECRPDSYNKARNVLESVRWTQEQKIADVHQYVNMAFKLLDGDNILNSSYDERK